MTAWLIHAVTGILFVLAMGSVAAYLWGFRSYMVMSGSMEPAIATGSICIVDTNAVYEEIREGDVIAFWRGGNLVAHRVIRIAEEGLETKGDANRVSDGITTAQDNFHGEVVKVVPGMGYIVHAFQQPEILWIVGILLAAVILWEIGQEWWIL